LNGGAALARFCRRLSKNTVDESRVDVELAPVQWRYENGWRSKV
jgi:hypothetical protein